MRARREGEGESRLAFLRSSVMSLSQIRLAGVGCGRRERIDNAVSPERERRDWGQFEIDLPQLKDWWSPFRLNCRVLDWTCTLGEPLLELTSECRPQLKPGGKLSYNAQHEGDRWPLRQSYSLCLSFITPAAQRHLIELKGRLKSKKKPHITPFTLL